MKTFYVRVVHKWCRAAYLQYLQSPLGAAVHTLGITGLKKSPEWESHTYNEPPDKQSINLYNLAHVSNLNVSVSAALSSMSNPQSHMILLLQDHVISLVSIILT